MWDTSGAVEVEAARRLLSREVEQEVLEGVAREMESTFRGEMEGTLGMVADDIVTWDVEFSDGERVEMKYPEIHLPPEYVEGMARDFPVEIVGRIRARCPRLSPVDAMIVARGIALKVRGEDPFILTQDWGIVGCARRFGVVAGDLRDLAGRLGIRKRAVYRARRRAFY